MEIHTQKRDKDFGCLPDDYVEADRIIIKLSDGSRYRIEEDYSIDGSLCIKSMEGFRLLTVPIEKNLLTVCPCDLHKNTLGSDLKKPVPLPGRILKEGEKPKDKMGSCKHPPQYQKRGLQNNWCSLCGYFPIEREDHA